MGIQIRAASGAVACAAAVIIAVGCGRPEPYEQSTAELENTVISASQVAGELGVQLVATGAASGNVVHARAENDAVFRAGVEGNQVVVEGDNIVFRRPVILPPAGSDRRVFLALNSDLKGRRIVDARFEHSIEEIGVISDNGKLENLSFDQKGKKWVLPLDRLVNHSSVRFGTGRHLVDLDLIHSDGTRSRVFVSMSLTSPVPLMRPRPEATPALPGPEEAHRRLSAEGLTVARETYVNPTPRRLILWVRSGGEVNVLSQLRVNDHRAFPNRAPVPRTSVQRSVGRARVSRLHVVRITETPADRLRRGEAGGPEELAASETLPLREGEWKAVYVGPYQRVTLSWTALPSGGAKCALPRPSVRDYTWFTERKVKKCVPVIIVPTPGLPPRVCSTKTVRDRHSTRVSESASVEGTTLSGNWSREIRLADEFVSEREATASVEELKRDSEYPVLRWQISEIRSGAEPVLLSTGRAVSARAPSYSCQGTFR